jgi:toxin-antitoxin system PIN domain toxin
MKSSAGVLLDANVLIAMAWPEHVSHGIVSRWLGVNADRGWATCALTQLAFVRILSNPAFTPNALRPKAAIDLLEKNLRNRFHRYWACDISFDEAVSLFKERIVGHQQVSDAYLLGLAMHHKGRLVTLDRGSASLASSIEDGRRCVELIA